MIVLMLLLITVAIVAIAATIRAAVLDGYGRRDLRTPHWLDPVRR
jgi:hypothetical protein